MKFILTTKSALSASGFLRVTEFCLLFTWNGKNRTKSSSSVLSVAEKQLQPKENAMKKKKMNKSQTDDMLPEYNLEGKKGVRGKYAKSLQKGYSVRVVKEDGTVTVRDFVPK